MRLLKTAFHPDVSPVDITPESELTLVVRHAARGIVVEGENILLLYTERYRDYSLPGGGIDEGENFVEALKRELREETGAKNVRNIKPFVRYELVSDDFLAVVTPLRDRSGDPRSSPRSLLAASPFAPLISPQGSRLPRASG